jgi:surface antigen
MAAVNHLGGATARCARAVAAVAAALMCMAPVLAAQGWLGVLKNTPAEQFDEEDLQIFIEHARKALNDTPDGQTVRWQNPASGSGGELTPVKSFSWKQHPCRELRIQSTAGGRTGSSTANLCRVDERWRAVTPSQLKQR